MSAYDDRYIIDKEEIEEEDLLREIGLSTITGGQYDLFEDREYD